VDQKKIDAKKEEQLKKETDECTFVPKTINYKGHKKQTLMQATHGDRCQDLYSLKPQGWFVSRGEKTHDDYDYERSKEDLTFSPLINDPEKVANSLQRSKVDSIRGMDKVRDRMERAR